MQERGTGKTMETEPQASTESASESDMFLLGAVEDGVNAVGSWTWDFFHGLPFHGAFVGGVVGLAAATVFGVAELAAAGLSAYVSYRMFAYGESFTEALENTIKFEKGQLPMKEIKKPIVDKKK